jgi:hypothetical protein
MKDPLIHEKTPYELFEVDPVAAQPKNVMKEFPRVSKLMGAQAAQEIMRQILRPERRLVLDLFNYYWVRAGRESSADRDEIPDVRTVVKKVLLESYPYDRVIDELFPTWTDLDRQDFSSDFKPIHRSRLRTNSPSFKETDATDILEAAEPDF